MYHIKFTYFIYIYVDVCGLRRTLGVNALSFCNDDYWNDVVHSLLPRQVSQRYFIISQ